MEKSNANNWPPSIKKSTANFLRSKFYRHFIESLFVGHKKSGGFQIASNI